MPPGVRGPRDPLGTLRDIRERAPSGPIPGPVVGQYFAFFNGVSKQHYEEIVARAPFEDCNLLILAFVRAIKKGDVYVAQFRNWRDNGNPSTPGDSDQDRVKLVIEAARAKNPSLKILISLGWADKPLKRQEINTVPWNDAGHAATTPGPFARSMASIVRTFGLDGIDIDYESVEVEPKNMLILARETQAGAQQGLVEARNDHDDRASDTGRT